MEDVSLNLKCEEEENHTESSGAIEFKVVMPTIKCDGPVSADRTQCEGLVSADHTQCEGPVSSEQAPFERPGIPDHKQSSMAYPPIQIEPETTAGSSNESDAGTSGTTNSYSLIVQSEGGDAQEIVLEITMESGVAGIDLVDIVKSEEESVMNINCDKAAITDPQDLNVSDVKCEERGETSYTQDLNVSDVKCEERGETSDLQDLKVSDVRCKAEDVKVELTTCDEGGEVEVESGFGDTMVPQSTVQESDIHKCAVCYKVYSNRKSLMNHHRVQHVHKEDRFKCEVCNRPFKYSQSLTIHKRTHTGEKPCKCRICGKDFREASALRRHLFMHTGEKPHKCQFCEKAFNQASTCRVHTMYVHTGDKPYKCDVCGKGFIRSGLLTLHTRRHTGERPYICSVCGKGFIAPRVFQYHLESHRTKQSYNCTVCHKKLSSAGSLKSHKQTHTVIPLIL